MHTTELKMLNFRELMILVVITALLGIIVVQHRALNAVTNELLDLNELFCETDIQCQNRDYSDMWEGK